MTERTPDDHFTEKGDGMRIVIVATVLLMASGCYYYAPGGMPPTAGSAEIRLVLERD